MKKYILSIDQGTTSSRVILFNKKFNMLDIVQKELKQYFPQDGWIEHDAIEIWKDIKILVRKILTKNLINSSEIISIAITNQRETTVLWNKRTGKPIYKAIVWQDRRTLKICEKLKKRGLQKKIQSISGLLIDPFFSATKILWILNHIKISKKLIKKENLLFGTIDSWLLWNLTEKKHHLTDITNASRTMLFDIKKDQWSSELINLLKIPKSILPKVVPNVFNFGHTRLFGSKILIGGMAGDQHASMIGQACFKTGQSKSTFGTGCFLLMNIGNKFQLSKNNLLTTIAFKIHNEKMYCYEGSIFVAGSAIQWLRDKLRFFKNSSDTNKLYKKANKNENITFIPALTGLGAPHWNSEVRGAIFGITRNTSISDIVKATIQSIAFQTFDLIKCMEKDSHKKIYEMYIDGGMIKNNNFVQFLSDILQIKIICPKNIETTALGAAFLAGLSAGIIKNLKEIEKLRKVKSKYSPKVSIKYRNILIIHWQKIISMLLKK